MRRFALVLVIVLAACASSNDPITAVYNCTDGTRLDVVYEPGQVVITNEFGTMMTLEQQPSASGIWYSSAKYDLRGKGRDAIWTVGRRKPVACRAR